MVPAIPALAQTASQITLPTYAPPIARTADGGLTLGGSTGLEAPKGAETLSVTPSGLTIAGGRPELSGETAAIEAVLKGKRVTGADLFAAARKLEEAYARAGYVLARVSLPPQTIRNGQPLRLVVTEGFVEAIDGSALPEPIRHRVDAMLAPLVGKSGLTRADLERRLLLAGDTPGVMLTSTLKAGVRPGAAVIVVEGRYDPITATLAFDNGMSHALGRSSAGLGVDANGLLGLGEVAYLRLNGYPGFNDGVFNKDPRNRQAIAGVTLPLGTDGAWLNLEAVDSRTHPTSTLAYTMADRYQRFSTRLGYNWVRSRDVNTSSTLAFDVTEERQTLDLAGVRTPFTEDRLRVLRLTQTGDALLPRGGQISGGVTASFGLDALGARSATTALPLSRDGARPDFQKLEASVAYAQSVLDERLHLSLAAKAQTSFGQVLASSEQIGLGGFDWLSAFDGGLLQGDAGAAVRAEVSVPLAQRLGGPFGAAAAPYVFGAGGFARLEQPSAVEARLTRASSLGAGIRFGLSEEKAPQSATLTLEYAHGAATGIPTQDRFNLRVSTRF
ncbi:ShlB/FhaC/HecB family hemolysin secretion/activation protein [Siculibacillus lacustris]|uniref:ShlB/FhaC/HecB family hemolysin secretion/activation protein n=2 Tax=Siculibacillus lacustris TaxID=1549641 RepID=A0A4Q9VR18_9HYPH|nr:ShlB/FhaC/HecB family hemolysin secretion/activation protein [Siculibacillus lacustris]